MKTMSVVMVGFDENYIASLEIELLKTFGEHVELTVITKPDYFQYFFSESQKIDVLIIEKELYDVSIERQNVENVFVLEESEETGIYRQNVTGIYKYTTVKEIFYKISGKLGTKLAGVSEDVESTKTLMVYSPIGGVGKTTMALLLCNELAEFNKRVLYVNTETIQNFQWLLSNKDTVSEEFCTRLANKRQAVLSKLNWYIGNEGFDYLKPISGGTILYDIGDEDYIYLISELVKSKQYDYIVVDTGSAMNRLNSRMLGLCDIVLTIIRQDAQAVWKTEGFLEMIDFSDSEKFLFLCNCFDEAVRNYIIESDFLAECNVIEYVPKIFDEQEMDYLSKLKKRHWMKQTAMSIL